MAQIYKCPRCDSVLSEQCTVHVSSVEGPFWKGTVLLRCETCNTKYEKPISMMVMDDN